MSKIWWWQIVPLLCCLFMMNAEEKKELTVGTTLDLSRGIRTNGKSTEMALQAVFAKAQVPGYQLHLDVRDDYYEPETALKNVTSFINEHVAILLMPLGSATFKAYFELIKQGKILVLFPNPGIPETRNKEIHYCINLRPSYADESAALTRYLINHKKPKKVFLFYQDDDFGKACISAAQQVLKAEKIDMILMNYSRNDLNFSSQIKKMQSAEVDAFGLFITSIAAKELFSKLDDDFLRSKKQFFGISDVGQREVLQLVKDKNIQIIISNVVPNPEKSDMPLVQEFREQVSDHDTFALEAYIGGSLFIDILNRAKKPITKESVIEAAESIHDYFIKGLPISFNPTKRQMLNHVWINNGNEVWEQVEIKQ